MRLRPLFFVTCVLCAAAPLAHAQGRGSVEIAPFIGYRFGDIAMPLGDGAST